MTFHADLFAHEATPGPGRPSGFAYRDDLIGRREEQSLARAIAELPFQPFQFHGYLGRRRVVSFGLHYDYGRRGLTPSAPLPSFLKDLRECVSDFAGLAAVEFVQALVTEYSPGAGIGWHRDKGEFGAVAGVSLLAPCILRFRRRAGPQWERASASLAPRSAYVLTGPARHAWYHSIAPMAELRYSVTFRSLAGAARDEG